MPALTIEENGDRVRLDLGGFARGEGSSLQEAADSLIRRAVEVALAFRASGYRMARELQPDLEALTLLYEVADIASSGGDVRARLFE